MKKILFLVIMSMSIGANWTPVSQEKLEYDAIRWQIAAIKERFCSRGGGALSSPCLQTEIFRFLKSIGTPVSYKILQEMIKNKELPAYYLNAA